MTEYFTIIILLKNKNIYMLYDATWARDEETEYQLDFQ